MSTIFPPSYLYCHTSHLRHHYLSPRSLPRPPVGSPTAASSHSFPAQTPEWFFFIGNQIIPPPPLLYKTLQCFFGWLVVWFWVHIDWSPNSLSWCQGPLWSGLCPHFWHPLRAQSPPLMLFPSFRARSMMGHFPLEGLHTCWSLHPLLFFTWLLLTILYLSA